MKKTIYRNNRYRVVEEHINIRRKKVRMFMVDKPNAVVLIPMIDKDTVLMEYQYRYPVNRYIYELPAGGIEKGESAAVAAARELEEETGYKAGRLRRMFKVIESPGITNTIFTFYLAEGLYKGSRKLDDGEKIKPRKVKLKDAIRMINDGRIDDGKTVLGIIRYLYCRKGRWKVCPEKEG